MKRDMRSEKVQSFGFQVPNKIIGLETSNLNMQVLCNLNVKNIIV